MSVRTTRRTPSGTGGDGPGAGRRTAGRAARGVASSRARFEHRTARARRRPWRLAGWGLLVLAVLLGLVWLLALGPVLAVREVRVTGLTDAGETAAVLAAADVPDGTPLARVDTAGAARRVGEIATVASVEVTRSWPGTVTVAVTRKTPALAVRLPDGTLRVVDTTGSPYEQVAAVPAGVPLVTSSSASPDPQGLRAAAGVLQVLPADLRRQVTGMTVASADAVSFQLGDVTVRWGGPADGPKKARVLQILLGTKPATVDVSAPDTPTTT